MTELSPFDCAFAGTNAIRSHSPECRLLVLTEACYSGGGIKFMDSTKFLYKCALEPGGAPASIDIPIAAR